MKPIANYDTVQAQGEFERLAPGGYVLRILEAKDNPEKQYLTIVFDIAEGTEAGRFKDEKPENEYRHAFIRSYKEKALGMFKSFTNALEDSNNGYKWDWDEIKLKGKLLGVVFGYEEYEANDGNIKQRLRVANTKSAADIRSGNYKTPATKLLKRDSTDDVPEGFKQMAYGDYPF